MEKKSKNKLRGFQGMEFIDEMPVCLACLNNNHHHPTDEQSIKDKKGDCTFTDMIEGQTYQCMCGAVGVCVDRKWHWFDNK